MIIIQLQLTTSLFNVSVQDKRVTPHSLVLKRPCVADRARRSSYCLSVSACLSVSLCVSVSLHMACNVRYLQYKTRRPVQRISFMDFQSKLTPKTVLESGPRDRQIAVYNVRSQSTCCQQLNSNDDDDDNITTTKAIITVIYFICLPLCLSVCLSFSLRLGRASRH